MNADVNALLSGAVTFGVPLAVCIRDLFVLKRDRGGGGWGKPSPPSPPPPDSEPTLPPALRPLPDCLIPKLGSITVVEHAPETRVLEPA